MEQKEMEQDELVVIFNEIRTTIKNVAASTRKAIDTMPKLPTIEGETRGEVMANLTLAYRHLEDASMRIGKAIQARDGGKSVYDPKTTVGA
jgi:hypothetical protein